MSDVLQKHWSTRRRGTLVTLIGHLITE